MMELFATYSGTDFLLFYAGLLVAAVVAGVWIARQLRPDGRDGGALDMEQAAFLSGGNLRVAEAATAELYSAGVLAKSGRHKLAITARPADPGRSSLAAQAILNGDRIFDLAGATKAVSSRARELDAAMVQRGYLMDRGERWKLRLLSASPYLVLLVLGLYRRQAGAAMGEPTGFLTGLLVFTAVLAIIRLISVSPLTRAGQDALGLYQDQSARLRSAPTAGEAGLAVALFGTGVLVGTPFEGVHAMRQRASDSGGSSDSGGGGCGGGGCGGCGG